MRLSLLALGAALALALPLRGADLRFFNDAALHAVQFIDRDEGWAVGDEGAVWHTIDGGKTWERQATGVRASLRALHFLTPWAGWVAGREELPHGGGSAGVLLFTGDGGVAVGQGGLVLLCDNLAETPTAWGYANLRLPQEVRAGWDFHAVGCAGKHVWAAGRPGSVVLHSGDGGATWEVQPTGQPVPLQG